MDNENLVTILKQIKALADQALGAGGGKPAARTRAVKTNVKAKQSAGQELPDHILALRDDDDFFKEPKVAKEVHAKLKTKYHCEINRVEVSLYRMFKQKKLRKTSKEFGGKKRVAYVW